MFFFFFFFLQKKAATALQETLENIVNNQNPSKTQLQNDMAIAKKQTEMLEAELKAAGVDITKIQNRDLTVKFLYVLIFLFFFCFLFFSVLTYKYNPL